MKSIALNVSFSNKESPRILSAIIDTGSSYNFINSTQTYDIKCKNLNKEPLSVFTANGYHNKSSNFIHENIKIEGISKQFEICLYLLENCNPDIIIGLDFLLKNTFTLNLSNAIFSLDNTYLRIPNYVEPNYPYEKEPFSKTIIACVSDQNKTKNKALETINNYELINSSLGNISSFKHCIEITDMTPFCCKKYQIPFSKLNIIIQEIERLKTLKINRASTNSFISPAFPL